MKTKISIVKDNQADVGIGTLIIFIAMILVAAVAAAVLIQTSGVLQQRAQATGKEATAEVSSNLKVVSVVGERDNPASTDLINRLNVTVELSAGGSPIDFNKVVVKYIDAGNTKMLINYGTPDSNADTTSLVTHFKYGEDRDPSGTSTPVLAAGDLGYVVLYLQPTTGMDVPLDVRKKSTIQIIPEKGTMIVKEITSPDSFGTDQMVQLFP